MQPIPIFRSAHLLPYLNYLHEVGAPVERGLRLAGLPSLIDNQGETYLPLLSALRFLTDINRREGIGDFGLRAVEHLHTTDLSQDFIGALKQAPTLYVALQTLCKLVSIEDPNVKIWIAPGTDNIRIYSSLGIPCDMQGLNFSEWVQNMAIIAIVRAFARPKWNPDEIAFRSNITPGRFVAGRFPNTRFLTGQKHAWITVPRAMLSFPSTKISTLDGVSLTSPSNEDLGFNYPASLKLALKSYLADGYPNIALAAEIAGTSVRTLQRRLKQFQLSYSDLVHQAQYEYAVELLKDPVIRTLDVAYAVGYEDPSNFARAFRRIAGMGPNEYRH